MTTETTTEEAQPVEEAAAPAPAKPKVLQYIEQAATRLQKHPKDKPFAARKFLLREMLPIIEAFYHEFNAASAATDANFTEVFTELGIGPDHLGFLQRTRVMITGLSGLVDLVVLEAGFMEKLESGEMKPTDKAPKAVIDALAEQGNILIKWNEDADLLVASLEAEQEAELDDDDDDDDDGDEPAAGDEGKESENADN